MQVEEVMTSPVVTVGPATTLHDAVGTMLEHRVGSVVVVQSSPVGIMTRSDVLRTVYRTGGSLEERTVRQGMSDDLITTTPGAPVKTAITTMESHGIKKLPVVDDLELAGIVTMTDIAQYYPERVREARASVTRKDRWTG